MVAGETSRGGVRFQRDGLPLSAGGGWVGAKGQIVAQWDEARSNFPPSCARPRPVQATLQLRPGGHSVVVHGNRRLCHLEPVHSAGAEPERRNTVSLVSS